jgi:hypothetical protein
MTDLEALPVDEEFVSDFAIAARTRMTLLVNNAADQQITVKRLNTAVIEGDPRRILLRPTPGTITRSTLAWDLLAAMGKSTAILNAKGPGPGGWRLASAWMTGYGVTDVIVDRAHLLNPDLVQDLVNIGHQAVARVWLIYSSPTALEERMRSYTEGSGFTRVLEPNQMSFEFPADIWWPHPDEVGRKNMATWEVPKIRRLWTHLPDADFPTFLATARRSMDSEEFELAERYYWHAFERTEAWLDNHLPDGQPGFGPELAAWLRDVQIGPVPYGQIAQIVLRGTQAGLFNAGVFLRWDRARLGPNPGNALCGNLAGGSTLTQLVETEAAAAAALSLHLNVGPFYFDAWRLADVEPDGSILHPPPTSPPSPVRYLESNAFGTPVSHSSNVAEVPCHLPVLVPRTIRPLIAAHLAWRRYGGAGDRDQLFTHPHGKRVYARLRNTINTSLAQLNYREPPWLHPDPCRHGADDGLVPRTQGWLIERGLSVHLAKTAGLR